MNHCWMGYAEETNGVNMTNALRSGWKILTHDGRSPLQGGPPLVTGPLPFTLPTVPLDTSFDECAAGWNYVAEIATGWRIAGMWPTGYPTRVLAVEAAADALQRGDKRRASSLTLLREATVDELGAAFDAFSRPFGVHQTRMAQEQAAWYRALGRPHQDAAKVEAQLTLALSARDLPWRLQRFPAAMAAWAAAWDARAARVAWADWIAWDAQAALTTLYARLMGWQDGEPDQYTVGIQDAYANGLTVVLPVKSETLGWVMEERGEEAIGRPEHRAAGTR